MAIADKIRDIFKSSNMNAIDDLEQEENFFHKGKKPSKEDLEELGIDEDDMDDVYSEGAEEDFDEDESEDEEEDEEETEEEDEEDEDEKEMKKSAIESLIQDQSTLEELSIELIKQNKEQAKEIGFLKSKVEHLSDEPLNPKNRSFTKAVWKRDTADQK